MSFILDAIKKSERERNRSREPDLHSLQDSAPRYGAVNRHSTGSRLLMLFIAIAILLLGFAWLGPQVASQFAPLFERATVVDANAAGGAAAKGVENNTAVLNGADSNNSATSGSTSAASIAQSQLQDSSVTQNYYAIDDEIPPLHQIKELWQLPADYQSTIPKLDFSFHVFSIEPQKRTIIINGRRMREGQMVASGMKLRLITETGVILYSQGRFFHVDVIEKW